MCTTWSTIAPPPDSSGSVNHERVSGSMPLFAPRTENTSPRRPDRFVAASRAKVLANRTGKATMSSTPAASAAARMASPSSQVVARGFSHSTCAPAAAACSTSARCRAFSLVTTTASTPLARSSSTVSTYATPSASASSRPRRSTSSLPVEVPSGSVPTTSTSGIACSADR